MIPFFVGARPTDAPGLLGYLTHASGPSLRRSSGRRRGTAQRINVRGHGASGGPTGVGPKSGATPTADAMEASAWTQDPRRPAVS